MRNPIERCGCESRVRNTYAWVSEEESNTLVVLVSAGSAVHPKGKILQVLQLSNIRLRLRHNVKSDLFTIGEQYSFVTKKGIVEYPPERVIDSYKDSDEAMVAFIRKAHEVTSELVSKLS
jgi:hypothetical protein